MVNIPQGRALIGAPSSDSDASPHERPQHRVSILYDLSVSKFPVTFDEWDYFVEQMGLHSNKQFQADDMGWGRGRMNAGWRSSERYIV